MPPKAKVTKDFLKLVFADKKALIPMTQLRPVTVPKYDELSVKNLIADIMTIPELAKFFPAQNYPGCLPEREYFFNVLNTIDPHYVQALITHAQTKRFADKNPQDNPNLMEISEHWAKELEASPYISSKS
jgi:hypothetical protein